MFLTKDPSMTPTPGNIDKATTTCQEEEEWLPRCDISTSPDHTRFISFSAKEVEEPLLCSHVPITPCDMQSTSTHVKEEPLSASKHLLDFDIFTPHAHCFSVSIKEEPLSAEQIPSCTSTPTPHTQSTSTDGKDESLPAEERFPKPNIYKMAHHTQSPSTYIKEEPLSAKADPPHTNHSTTSNGVQPASKSKVDITYSNLSTPSGPVQFTTVCIKEETCSSDEEHLICSDTSHIQHSSNYSPFLEEPFSRGLEEQDAPQPEGVASCISRTGDYDAQPSREKVFFCYECDSCFNSKSELVRHQRGHTGQKAYSCPECGKGFTTSLYLMKHRRIHSGDKSFVCSECGKSFTHKADLVIHGRTHTGEKPFSCSECRKRFISQSYLIKHQRSHTGDKQYSCSECGKSFGTNTYLIIHQRIHTGEKPFSCPECEKCFISDSYLSRHMRVHTGEKPFSCAQCGKRFASNSQLCNHRKSHSGERPYFCLECGKGFTWRAKRSTSEDSCRGRKCSW